MIYSKATGGLGNQLYTYAIGFALAKKYGDALTIDLSQYRFSPRPYVLDHFTVSYPAVSICPSASDAKLCRMFARFCRILSTNRYGYCKWMKERFPETRNSYGCYDFSHKKSLYLEGYWQHYRYFDEYRDLLCREFQLKEEYITDACASLIEECTARDSVAVHIRRGDYEASWLLPDSYYHHAFEKISSLIPDPHYYIFCEDQAYVRERYGYLSNTMLITGNYGLSDLEEFHLMSKCRHQITANSSFSWWAAYLNTYPDKLAIAPEYKHWTKDYYPEDWIVIAPDTNSK